MSRYSLFLVYVFTCLFYYGNGAVTPPKLKLNDGRDIPSIALGTWLGNNTKAKIDSGVTAVYPREDIFGSFAIKEQTLTFFSQHGRVEPSTKEVEMAVMWALDAGYRHIDTAYAYKIEDQVGRGLKKKMAERVAREDLFITTKLWNDRHAREEVVPALQESLSKLMLDYVDLYLIHWPIGQFDNQTYDYTDYLETWRGMIDAKKLGLTKSIGLSNFNQQMMDRIVENGLEKPAVLQVELNLNLQQPELLAYCRKQDIVVMGYTPFGSIFYSKAKEDSPPPRVDDPALVAIGKKYGKTVPQVVLRYLVELGIVPIPKSLTKSRIEQNIDIFDFQLTEEEKNTLKAFDKNYRTIPQHKWLDHPYYPFEKKE